MTADIDYSTVELPDPDETPYTDWHYTQRRAYILRTIEDQGHPKINQRAHAQRFGVSEAQLSKDMDKLRAYIADNIDQAKMDAISLSVFQKATTELLEEGEFEAASRVVERMNDWLFDRGKVEKAPEKQHVTHAGGVATGEVGDLSEENRAHFDRLMEAAREEMAPTTHDLSQGAEAEAPESESDEAEAEERDPPAFLRD